MWMLNAITSLTPQQLKDLSNPGDPTHVLPTQYGFCCGMTPGGASQGVASFAAAMGTASAIGSLVLLLVCMAGLGARAKFDPSRKK
ncbi:MAG: hypothetical protein ACP5OS_03920 [Leptospirillia bacterium]|jgi:hypothetical protein